MASAPIFDSPGFFSLVFRITFFLCHFLLSNIIIVDILISGEREMNPVRMVSSSNLRKEMVCCDFELSTPWLQALYAIVCAIELEGPYSPTNANYFLSLILNFDFGRSIISVWLNHLILYHALGFQTKLI